MVHTFLAYNEAMTKRWGSQWTCTGSTFPLFPTAQGGFHTRDSVIGLIRSILGRVTPLTKDRGDGVQVERFHHHCLRVAGAYLLTLRGMPLETTMLYGRWGSTAVRRYVQDVPLVRAEREGLAARQSGMETAVARLEQRVDKLARAWRDTHRAAASQHQGLKRLRQHTRRGGQEAVEITNRKTEISHRATREPDQEGPGRTWCGWRFNKFQYRLRDAAKDAKLCERCYASRDSSSEPGDLDADSTDSE